MDNEDYVMILFLGGFAIFCSYGAPIEFKLIVGLLWIWIGYFFYKEYEDKRRKRDKGIVSKH